MTRNFTKIFMLTCCMLIGGAAFAQTTVSGTVKDAASGEPLIGVNVLVKGTVLGTITDAKGRFSFVVSSPPPFTLVISSVGFVRQELEVTSGNATGLTIALEESVLLGQEVVVSASRVEESVLKSPVSVERMDILDIQNTASTDFYSALKNLNGVDFSTQSITFNSVNARGFNANGNTRFVQLIDGIDNQAPGLNFPVGNVVGINELDLESVEMIPGAASALYGPNAIQGILLMNSKSPFDYQGFDIYSKLGVNHVDGRDDDAALYKDMGFRLAKAFNNKWAFKITGSWLNAQDFRGVDYRDQSDIVERSEKIDPLNRAAYRNYDGVNTYGDFPFNFSSAIAANPALAPVASLLPTDESGNFTPTGFRERDFVDNTTESLKFGAALHYRISDKYEVFGQYNIGYGSSVYTANDRFILDDFSIWTGKIELRGSNFFLRAYTTQENAGKSYAANTLASRINQQYYLPDYIGAFVAARGGGATVDQAHDAARAYADDAQQNGVTNGHAAYAPGTAEFNRMSSLLRNRSIAEGGALFLDRSKLYHYEGSYNFKDKISFAEVIVGANYRKYALESEGTLFALDNNGEEISFGEGGGYVQLKRDIIENVTLQGSVRYDKNVNFQGQFSPRVSAVWEFMTNHNLRASFQRGFRIPTTQDQYIDLDVVSRRLIGRNEILADRYNIVRNSVYTTQSVQAAQQGYASGDLTIEQARSLLTVANDAYKEYKPEKVTTFEVGYKGLLLDGRLFVDVFYYQSYYTDLLAEVDVTQAVDATNLTTVPDGYETDRGVKHTGSTQLDAFINGGDPGNGVRLQRYGYDTNVDETVKSRGWGVGMEYTLGQGYVLGGNASYNELLELDNLVQQEYNVAFNTAKWRYNVTFGNRKLTKRMGFNVAYRWQDAYLWQSAIGSGIIPQFGTVDAQVTYNIPSMNARLKFGGSNITNERFTTSLANPAMGAIYYIQLNLDNILNK
jgi:iron complex outermembrane recepter protein